jgi:hypothetical protein
MTIDELTGGREATIGVSVARDPEAVMPRTRRPYPSDLTDREWALLKPLLASSERRGRPPKWPARRVADAVFYLLRSGCAWRMLPRE